MGTLYRRKGSPKWYGEYTDSLGKRVQRSTGTTIKRDAESVLRQWETDANNQRHGLAITPQTTLETLLAEYIKYLAGTTQQHRDLSENRVRRVLDACGFTYPRDLDRIQVENAIRSFQTPSKRPISLRSQGHYITAVKSFTKWLTNLRGALLRDPLAGIKKPNFERDRKKKRRYLTHEEWFWLKQVPNSLLYEVAIQTGLRVSELRALRPESLQDDHLLLSARHTKNGRPAKQFISTELHDRLVGQLPLSVPPKDRAAEHFYASLAQARALWLESKPPKALAESKNFLCPLNDANESLDMHSLRHTCGAWLAMAGCNVKVIQSIMRHSTITLTLDTYGHLMPGAEQEAAAQLSVILSQPLRTIATHGQPSAKTEKRPKPAKIKGKR
jgi:integrase